MKDFNEEIQRQLKAQLYYRTRSRLLSRTHSNLYFHLRDCNKTWRNDHLELHLRPQLKEGNQ